MSVRLVNWPDMRRTRFELHGRIPEERLVLHWACVDDDAAEDFPEREIAEAKEFAHFMVAREKMRRGAG